MKRGTRAMLLAVIGAAVLLAGARAEDTTKIMIGTNYLRISLPVFVAQGSGIFQKNGLNVELQFFETAQPLMDALCGGKLDIAGYTAFPITFAGQARSKTELNYTTAMLEDDAHPISMFVVKADSNITSLAELKGKKIGILPTYAYKVWLELVLKQNGIQPEEVTIQQVAPALSATTLQSGGVDVLFTNDPAVTVTVQKGIGKILIPGAVVPKYLGKPFFFASFNMTKSFVNKNPDSAKKIVKSLDEAIAFIHANPAEAKKIMAQFLPEAQRGMAGKFADSLYLPSAEVQPDALSKLQDEFLKQGIVKEKLDLSAAVLK